MNMILNPLLPIKLMNMLRYLSAMVLFSRGMPHKEHYDARVVGVSAAFLLIAAMLPVIEGPMWHITALFLIECLLSMCLLKLTCYIRWPMVFFVASAAFSAEHIASMLDSLIALSNRELLDYSISHVITVPMVINWLGCVVLVYSAIDRCMFHGKYYTDDDLSFSTMLLLLVISLGVNLIMNNVYSQLMPERPFISAFFEYVANIVCSVFLLWIQNSIMREGQTNKRMQMTALLWEQAREQYRISRETNEALNIKCHDLKHLMLALKDKADAKDYSDIISAIDSYGAQIETNNEVLDVVFQEKNFQCRREGIQFTCIIDGAAMAFMETTDQYVLFGNLIDNCIEAVNQLEEGQVKNILVNVHREKGFVLVCTENGFKGELQWEEGRLSTSKDDKERHGFGLLSIEHIVHKYKGRYSISTEGHVFRMNIVFPVKLPEQG